MGGVAVKALHGALGDSCITYLHACTVHAPVSTYIYRLLYYINTSMCAHTHIYIYTHTYIHTYIFWMDRWKDR